MIWVFKELTFPCSYLSKDFTDSSLYPTDTKLPVQFPPEHPGHVIRNPGSLSIFGVRIKDVCPVLPYRQESGR